MDAVERSDAARPEGAAVTLRGVSKTFNANGVPTQAVKDVSFDVGAGQFVSLIGPSGCGKTTIAKMVGDLIAPTVGHIAVGGQLPSVVRQQRRVGFVFQAPTLIEWRTLAHNVSFPLDILGWSKNDKQRRALELLELVGLGGFANHFPDEVSGGMKQRASIARALSFDPSVLIMDEPFGALDMITRDRMAFELLRIWTEHTKTVLFITHSIEEAVLLSDKVIAFTDRPARISEIVDVCLPRPRTAAHREDPVFVALTSRLRKLLEP